MVPNRLEEQYWKGCAKEGDSPVIENRNGPIGILSTTGHEKSCGNPGGPPSKAKY